MDKRTNLTDEDVFRRDPGAGQHGSQLKPKMEWCLAPAPLAAGRFARKRILAAGVVLLEKPFTREILSPRVRQVLDEPLHGT